MDGENMHGVVGNGSINMLPSWGSGGIIYTSFLEGKPDIYIGSKKITADEHHYYKAAFSPDGSKLAVAVNIGGQSDIWLMDPSSGKLMKNLTNNPSDDLSPAWSPDGGQIAFVSNRSGGPQIYVMDASGGGQKRLTMFGSYNSTPNWGKSGLIVFAGRDDENSNIYTVDTGGNVQKLTQDQGDNKDPCWSPDGRYVAFVSNRGGTGNQIYIMTADGRYQFPITEKAGGYTSLAWGK